MATSAPGVASHSLTSGNSQAEGNGARPGSSGFSRVAVNGLPEAMAPDSIARHIASDRSTIVLPLSASSCCSDELDGSPFKWSLSRTGGGPPGRNRTRLKLEHLKPLWKP